MGSDRKSWLRGLAEPGRSEIRPLTGIRFMAAVLVVISHSADILIAEFPKLGGHGSTLTMGDLGVGVFFFLSGYILTHTYASEMGTVTRGRWTAFMRRRFARVWPLHAFVIAALVALDGLFHLAHRPDLVSYLKPDFSALPAQLTLTHAWIPWHSGEDIPWNSPSWSISSEWFAYLLCPFLIVLLLRWRTSIGAAVAVGLVSAQFVVWKLLDVDSGITRIFGLFALGAFIWVALDRTRFRVPWPDAIVLVTVLVMLPLLGPTFGKPSRFFVILACALLIVPIAQSTGPVARVLGSRPLLFLGRASFAVYMTHEIVLRFARPLMLKPRITTNGLPERLAVTAALYTAIILVASLAYICVERPLERRIRGSRSQRASLEPQPAAGAPDYEMTASRS